VAFAVFSFADSVDELLKIGDHFLNRGEWQEALQRYHRAYAIDSENPYVLYRLGAGYNRLALNFSGKIKNDTLRLANSYITSALRNERNIAEAHCELAYNLTLMSLLHENWEDFAIARRIKEEIDWTLKLDPDIALIHFIYGIWHKVVSEVSILKRKPHGLGDASKEEIIPEFKKAVQLDPEKAQYWLQLGLQYLETGDTTSALKFLQRAMNSKPLPINKPYIESAEQMIRNLTDEDNN